MLWLRLKKTFEEADFAQYVARKPYLKSSDANRFCGFFPEGERRW
jgi:hypothetical protein